jgi:hypothetical protein
LLKFPQAPIAQKRIINQSLIPMNPQSEIPAQKPVLHEDWTVVVLGFLIITLSFFFTAPLAPVYSWKSFADLSNNVITGSNFLKILTQFIIVHAIGMFAMLLTGKPLKSFLYVFPFIFLLAVIAMILAGNSEVKALNLEGP